MAAAGRADQAIPFPVPGHLAVEHLVGAVGWIETMFGIRGDRPP